LERAAYSMAGLAWRIDEIATPLAAAIPDLWSLLDGEDEACGELDIRFRT